MHSDEAMGPEDIARLKEYFEEVCNAQRVAHRSAAADIIAKRVMQLYRAGVRDTSIYISLICTPKRHDHIDIYRRGSRPH
jgi:hypothetical protein